MTEKTITIVRHAKSSWDDPKLRDLDRPLKKRGFNDAELMGTHLDSLKIQLDCVVSSPANRAHTTAKILCQNIGFEINEIQQSEALYFQGINGLWENIWTIDDNCHNLALFGHNPTSHEFVEKASGQRFVNFPTCGVAHFGLIGDKWSNADFESLKLKWMVFPSDLKK